MVQPLSKPADFQDLLDDHSFSASLIGPGAGLGEETRSRVPALLETKRPVVLDADALPLFADDPDLLLKAAVGDCVMAHTMVNFNAFLTRVAISSPAPAALPGGAARS